MRCLNVRKHLSAFLDNELEDQTYREVRQHLAICDECCYELNKLRGAIAVIQDLPRLEPPPGMWLDVKAKLNSRREAGFSVPWSRKSPPALLTQPSWRTQISELITPWLRRPAYVALLLFVATLVFGLVGNQMFIKTNASEMPPLNLYIQEHAQYYKRQMLPPDPLVGLETDFELERLEGEPASSFTFVSVAEMGRELREEEIESPEDYELQVFISSHWDYESQPNGGE